MRRIVLGVLCATAFSSAGYAADLPVQRAAPVTATYAPAFSWTGFYLGANLGYGWGKASGTTTVVGNTFGANGVFPGSSHLDGINGGGQAGYNWQTGAFVWGIEGDYQGADQKRTTVVGCGVGCAVTDVSKINSFATVRGRLGYAAWDRGLLYVTGGWAYLNAKETVNLTAGGITANLLNLSTGKSGWTIGGGYEWSLCPVGAPRSNISTCGPMEQLAWLLFQQCWEAVRSLITARLRIMSCALA